MFKQHQRIETQIYDLYSLLEGLPFSDDCLSRHHDPKSEPYTGLDSLLTLMTEGWSIEHEVLMECALCFRHEVMVYHFRLHRDGEQREMAVITSPGVERLIRNLGLICLRKETYE